MLENYQCVFWGVLLIFVILRYVIAKTEKIGYFKNKFVNAEEEKEFKDARNHSMILASFTIVALSISVSEISSKSNDYSSLYFFSLSMIGLFISTLLFELQTNKWIPHTADILQKVGIICVAIGFLFLISALFTDLTLNIMYGGFFIGIIAYAIIDLFINWIFFHPKRLGNT